MKRGFGLLYQNSQTGPELDLYKDRPISCIGLRKADSDIKTLFTFYIIIYNCVEYSTALTVAK